jgi:adenylate cyclase
VTEQRVQRRLAAILAADVVGYSALMQRAEEATYAEFERLKRELIGPSLCRHEGRLIKTTGDGALAEFASPLAAMRCAVEMQDHLASGGSSLRLRVGLNLGDVIVGQDGDLYGDGINIAVRLEGIADPGGILISEKVYSEVEGKLDVGFEDRGEQQLKNICKPVRAYAVRAGAYSAPIEKLVAVLPLPDKPSIAALPFENMSGDPEQDYFADGMVEDIITGLSRIKWLFVIARNSSFAYKGRSVDVKQVGRELGVRYVLEGSVRKMGQRVRITVQLIDAANSAHLWAEHFDGTLEDVFELQDNVASSVAGVIEPTLTMEEYRRSTQRPTDDLTAYDLYLQARFARSSASREGTMRALELAGRALERDPNYGSALAAAAACQCNIYLSGWTNDLESTRNEGIDLARRALRVAGDDPYVLASAAFALGLFGEDIATAIALVERSLQLNPNFANGWYTSGTLRLWAGQYDLAIEHLKTVIRLSPRESRSQTYLTIGMGHFFARRCEEAAEMLDLSLQEKSQWPPTLRFMASCLAHLGRLEEARKMVKRLRAITPVVVPNADHWRIGEDRDFYLHGLLLAAGELK